MLLVTLRCSSEALSGGGYGICMPYLYTEGIQTLILSSVLKLIPGDLTQIMGHVSMRRCGFSYGMACSLAPIPGEIITEIEAIQFFAKVQAQIFAKGGFFGAQDSTAIRFRESGIKWSEFLRW